MRLKAQPRRGERSCGTAASCSARCIPRELHADFCTLQMIFPEIASEMRRPRDFIKGMATAQLVIFVCYLV